MNNKQSYILFQPIPKTMPNLFGAYSSKEARTGIRDICKQPVLIVCNVFFSPYYSGFTKHSFRFF